jgi:hypothetical protein
MVRPTRRRLLQGAALCLAGLAGCNGESTRSKTTIAGESRVDPSEATVPDHRRLRSEDVSAAVWLPDEDASPSATATETVSRPRDRYLVGSRETADRLRFVNVDGVEAVRAFVADTAFATETLLVESRAVRACYTLSLCNVSWSETSVETTYGSVLRDADVACEAEARQGVSMLVRIPAVLDPDEVSSSGSSWSSSLCYGGRGDDDASTDQPQYGPVTTGNASDSVTATATATSESSATTTEGGQ